MSPTAVPINAALIAVVMIVSPRRRRLGGGAKLSSEVERKKYRDIGSKERLVLGTERREENSAKQKREVGVSISEL